MDKFTIKPKVAGSKVLDPISKQPLKGKGEEKPRNEYWCRRILDGAVIELKTNSKES